MLECVVNVSEGRDDAVIGQIVAAGGDLVLDVHSDADHNRTVLTMAGAELEPAVRAVARRTVEAIDLRRHSGVHPRLGALDVVPFAPLDSHGRPLAPGGDLSEALGARDRFALWAGDVLDLPCFSYGPERSLPDVRRRAFAGLDPDSGPPAAHQTAGACAVGARFVLVAYNLWLATSDLDVARSIARSVRGPHVRALGLRVGQATQVSCNLTDPSSVGPAFVYDAVERLARDLHTAITRAELVGLAPRDVVVSTPPSRRRRLDLDLDRTIEERLRTTTAR